MNTRRGMSESVDVLAVLDVFCEDYRTYIPQFHAQNRKRMKRTIAELDDASAAVAELIEATKALRSFEYRRGVIHQSYLGDRCKCPECIEGRADAALARVQGVSA